MSLAKEYPDPCEYNTNSFYDSEGKIMKYCKKLDSLMSVDVCNNNCKYYISKCDDYDWKDHWC